MLRLLSSLCVAMALFLSPMVMAGGGMAMAHDKPEMSAEVGHCAPAPADESSNEAKMDCMSACAAVAPIQPGVVAQAIGPTTAHVPPGHQVHVGVQPEGETPPPRTSPAK